MPRCVEIACTRLQWCVCVLQNMLYQYKLGYNSVHACVAGVRADPSCEVGWDGCWVLPIVLLLYFRTLVLVQGGMGWVGCCLVSTSTCV